MEYQEYVRELQEECGVFGVYAPGEEVARVAFFGIFSLQHRGQESAGIAVTDGKQINIHKQMGLVTAIFHEEALASMRGHIAIGHTRYSTTGSSVLRNVQPMLGTGHTGDFALAHNGDLINAAELRAEMMDRGVEFTTTNDSEVIVKLIANSKAATIEEAIAETMNLIHGAYSVLVLTEKKLIAFRDPNGIRPLSLGHLNGHDNHFVVASETCAINTVGADFLREVEPGEIVIISEEGIREIQAVPINRRAICIFEFIYFARPDSRIYNKSLHESRRRMGHELAKEHPAPGAHIVFPNPDTGTPAAIGYAEASRIPYGQGVIKNHYIHRTFIQPDQRMREMGVRMKLSPLKENLAGKRVVMVDDSIIRGTTTRATVKMLKDAGATEVHVRISSPPYRYPCFFGIDTADQSELIAARFNVEEIRQHIGADSLGYLSLKGLVKAIGLHKESFCCACLDGKYPIEIPREVKINKFVFESVYKDKEQPL
ncbi:MAG: amidophosphoribosyltransferase [Armatimonadota bacterium]|nr:amidophosphoribosyltransferase [Armatimonadota bacterium]